MVTTVAPLQYEFMRNALAVGTMVALAAGVVGYFVVLRGQSFVAHVLSQVGFPGAAGAALAGVPPVAGLMLFCVLAAAWVGATGDRLGSGRRGESATVGSLLAFAFGLGLLFFRLAAGNSSSEALYSFLFGTIVGIAARDVWITTMTVVPVMALMALMARPLLFASVDPAIAEARGVPVRVISMVFLLLLALATAVTVQVTGMLLVFALMVAPAAVAGRLSPRPAGAIAISVALAVVFTWFGLLASYYTDLPVGFLVTSAAFAAYLLARVVGARG